MGLWGTPWGTTIPGWFLYALGMAYPSLLLWYGGSSPLSVKNNNNKERKKDCSSLMSANSLLREGVPAFEHIGGYPGPPWNPGLATLHLTMKCKIPKIYTWLNSNLTQKCDHKETPGNFWGFLLVSLVVSVVRLRCDSHHHPSINWTFNELSCIIEFALNWANNWALCWIKLSFELQCRVSINTKIVEQLHNTIIEPYIALWRSIILH